MAQPTLLPFRDFDAHDVLNYFALYSGQANKGTLVTVTGQGWLSTDNLNTNPIGAQYNNTQSNRWSITPRVTPCNTGTPVGMLLYDAGVETDENGEKLIFHPQKTIELQAVPSGYPVPIVTRGVFLISGTLGNPANAGDLGYIAPDGLISPTGGTAVGTYLGRKDANGYVFFKLTL